MARLTIKEVVQALFVKSNVFFFVKTNAISFRENECNFFS